MSSPAGGPRAAPSDADPPGRVGPPGAPPATPHLVFYEVTRRCPLACVHCRARAQSEPLPGELSTGEARRWISQLSGFGTRLPVLVLTGGDPLAREDLPALIDAARSCGLPTAVSPAVSPSLTPASLRDLRSAGVTAISFSLDGATAATHEAIRRRPGVFHATLSALRASVDLGFRVQMNTTVLRTNVGELPSIFRQVRELGLAAWEVFFLVRTGRGENLEDLSAEEYEAVGQFLYDASRYGVAVRPIEAPFVRRIVRQRTAGVRPPHSLAYGHLSEELAAANGPPTGPASLRPEGPLDGDGTLFVGHDGTIFPGGFVEVPLGNVRTDPVVDVYRRHPTLERIRRREFRGQCGRCSYRAACGGSRARAFAADGDVFGSDPACVLVGARPRPPGEAERPISRTVSG